MAPPAAASATSSRFPPGRRIPACRRLSKAAAGAACPTYRATPTPTPAVGGTSAVAPLWAGLVAVANQQLGAQVGFIQPALYAAKATAGFNDITQGNNPAFSAGPGWDACSGQGTPIASKLIPLLAPAAGTPSPTPAPTPAPGKKKKKKPTKPKAPTKKATKKAAKKTAGKKAPAKTAGKKAAKKATKKAPAKKSAGKKK
jgi:kumamolisin